MIGNIHTFIHSKNLVTGRYKKYAKTAGEAKTKKKTNCTNVIA